MLELKFYARDGRLAYDPTRARMQGQLPPYIGRTFDPNTRAWSADKEPYTVRIREGSSDAPKWLARVTKQAQRGDIWCADEQTASRLGMSMTVVELRDGEWAEVTSSAEDPDAEKAAAERAAAFKAASDRAASGKRSAGKKGSA